MKKLAIAFLATAALSVPAIAASNMPQQPQDQQSQANQPRAKQSQVQYPNNQPGQPSNANQAAANHPNKEQTISPKSLSRNKVRQVQQALDKKGVQVGRVDGRWGSKTSDALKQFQQSKSIQASGQLDQQTLSDLGLNGAQFAQHNQNNSSQTR